MTSQQPHGTGPWRPENPGLRRSASPLEPLPPFGPPRLAGRPQPAGGHDAPAPAGAGGFAASAPGGGVRKHGWYLVLAAAVLGVFVFCGIVVAAAGNQEKPAKTRDVARNGALGAPIGEPVASHSAVGGAQAASTAATTDAPAPSAAPTTAAVVPGATATTAGTKPATKPTTKPPTTKPPATKTATKPPAANCNPNYTPCVPNDPVDVDCAGGGGNGPSYVQGPVRVIGSDPYGLDNDHDGIGCE
ncbi:hypothetical protein [Dactylosporangium sp. CA-233914]|uniref:hypothetical protein n=1 Tax=Dactylosporangium sp. CA-233914 TaxID=3239934 RepID=UPI003D904DB5